MHSNKMIAAVVTCFVFGSLVAFAQPGGAPPNGEKRKPPQAAYDACASADLGDSCTVKANDRTISGTCREDRDDDSLLVCVPSGGPGGGKNKQR